MTIAPPTNFSTTGKLKPPKPGGFKKASESKRGSAIVLYGPEGWGKTTFAAYAPSVAFMEARDENGLAKLSEFGRIPDVNVLKCESWPQVLSEVDAMIADGLDAKFLAIDAMSGFERLCHEEVCRREFRGDWGEKGFIGFMKGYHIAVSDWIQFLTRLDQLRNKHRTTILMLGHSQIKNHQNPTGADFDRYVCDVHAKTWGVTHKWADAVLFGNFLTVVDEDGSRRKRGIGGSDRLIYAEHTDAYDAKNRFGLPEIINMPSDPSKSFSALATAMKGIKK